LKQVLKKALRRFGYRLNRLPNNILLDDDPFVAIKSNMVSTPVLFDIGANTGQTIGKMLASFPDARIHSFEPAANCIHELRESHGSRSNVVINQCAVGEQNGELSFNQYGWSSLNSVLERTFTSSSITGTYTVPVVAIDDYCKRNEIENIDLLKTDTEGYELHVLKGSKRMLMEGRIRFILVELFFIQHFEGQDEATDIIAFLKSNHFDLVRFYEMEYSREGVASRVDALFKYGNPIG
jgi:FkbM family methyltransferase